MFSLRATASLLAASLLLCAPASAIVTVSGNGSASNTICGNTIPQVCALVSTPGLLSIAPFVNSTGPMQGVQCDQNFSVSITATGLHSTQMTAAVAGKNVYICGFMIQTSTGTSPVFKFQSGTHTSTDCDTSEVDQTGFFGNVTEEIFTWATAGAPAFESPLGQTLCIQVSGASAVVTGFIKWTQF